MNKLFSLLFDLDFETGFMKNLTLYNPNYEIHIEFYNYYQKKSNSYNVKWRISVENEEQMNAKQHL